MIIIKKLKRSHKIKSKITMNKKGFTLLEILLVVALIAILAGIVILAINPTKQLGDTRNAKRRADVNTILNAVYQYSIDNNGTIPPGIITTSTEICYASSTCSGLVDLSMLILNQKYLVDTPKDPSCPSGCATNGTGYSIYKSSNNRVTVTAPLAEEGASISISR